MKLRKINIEDLLGQEPIQLKLNDVKAYVSGQVIMVTGGGRTIGSESCRQIANYESRNLIIFDIYENNAYGIQQELKRTHPKLNMAALIGSVRSTARINHVIEEYHPDIIYHATAHKYVPLMEDRSNEVVKNNVMGIYKAAEAACRYDIKKYVLISAGKAVRPTNIMGARKRICEIIIQAFNERSATEFASVRFGNVPDSNGSVIPLFKKILDLAENLLRLSGYIPYEEIQIKFIGLRPGENSTGNC